MLDYILNEPLSVLIFSLVATNILNCLQNMGLITQKSAEDKLKAIKNKQEKLISKQQEAQAKLMAQLPK